MMGLLLLTVAVIALAMLVMAVGTLFSNRCLRGSCGGGEVVGPNGEPLTCDTCPMRGQGPSEGTERPARPLGRA